ncbi:MAG: hypothetical protein WBE37_22970 [Bryobacteraceae bacterium]
MERVSVLISSLSEEVEIGEDGLLSVKQVPTLKITGAASAVA